MKIPALFALLLVLPILAGGTGAQTQNIAWFQDNVPTGSGNAFPWGSEGIRYQCIVPQSILGGLKPVVVNDILVAGRSADIDIVYGDIEIRMGVTTTSVPAASWTTNNPKPTTVYRGKLRVKFEVGKWNGIGMPASYTFIPTSLQDNLCIEVIIWKVDDKGNSVVAPNFYFPLSSANNPRAYLYQWTGKQTQGPGPPAAAAASWAWCSSTATWPRSAKAARARRPRNCASAGPADPGRASPWT